MQNLTKASRELFRRQPDECFGSLTALWEDCQRQKEASVDRWVPPRSIRTNPVDTGRLLLAAGDDGAFAMNDWSFGQLCRLAGVAKETVNRLAPDTAARVFTETLSRGNKPLQLLTVDDQLRSIHGTGYTRLFNADLLTVVREFATDFEAPPEGVNGGTGLYAGEQDMFSFMIDPTGWAEIDGEAFAPGFYLWNSEVGRRSVGVSTFWFQQLCKNHIVWDAGGVWSVSAEEVTDVAFSDIAPAFAYMNKDLLFLPQGLQMLQAEPETELSKSGPLRPRGRATGGDHKAQQPRSHGRSSVELRFLVSFIAASRSWRDAAPSHPSLEVSR